MNIEQMSVKEIEQLIKSCDGWDLMIEAHDASDFQCWVESAEEWRNALALEKAGLGMALSSASGYFAFRLNTFGTQAMEKIRE